MDKVELREAEHWPAEWFEKYSLGRLDRVEEERLENHLLICQACQTRLSDVEPYNFVHYLKRPFYSRITILKDGKFFARHWGHKLDGGREFRTLSGAKRYLSRSFSEMFPEHRCNARCGSTKLPERD